MNCLDGTSARVVSRDEDDDTIELELSESTMRLFAEAAALAEAGPSAGAAAEWPLRPDTSLRDAPAANQEEAVGTVSADVGPVPIAAAAPAATQGPGPVVTAVPATQSPIGTRALQKSRPRFGVALATGAVAAALLGGVTYLATARPSGPAPVATAPITPAVPAIAAVSHVGGTAVAPDVDTLEVTLDVPLRFKNPFDASEVFEFPPGTTADEARVAVAGLLAQRAQERLARRR